VISMNITDRSFWNLKYFRTILSFAMITLVATGCNEKGPHMFKEEAILCKADAALMRKCKFNSVRVERRTQGSAYEVRGKGERDLGLPMLHTGGEVSYQEQIFGDGEISIKIQIRDGSAVSAQIRSRELFKQACHEWADAVRSAFPRMEIVFLEGEN